MAREVGRGAVRVVEEGLLRALAGRGAAADDAVSGDQERGAVRDRRALGDDPRAEVQGAFRGRGGVEDAGGPGLVVIGEVGRGDVAGAGEPEGGLGAGAEREGAEEELAGGAREGERPPVAGGGVVDRPVGRDDPAERRQRIAF